MRRGCRNYLILIILCVGASFWFLVKNVHIPPDTPKVGGIGFAQEEQDTKMSKEILEQKLQHLETEIASQKAFSSILLGKVKSTFQTPKTPTLVEDNKVILMQRELQNVDHLGEVKSLEEQVGQSSPRVKDENGAHEVVEEHKDPVIAVLVFVCNRPTISRCVDSLLKYRTSETNFPIIVSQDCGHHEATSQALDVYGSQITHIFQPDLSEIQVPPNESKMKGYYKIARHYGWALNYTFYNLNYTNVLIVEDDLEIAPDFFQYFASTLPVLRNDPTLWCVSAWNDNGKVLRIDTSASDLLYRTDFFPGLGWMLTRELWDELSVKWPKGYWDDWMREPAQRKERACIRPEISRTSTFGKNGVSHGTYYQTHLRYIKLNDKAVPFSTLDLSYLEKDKYDHTFVKRVYSSQVLESVSDLVKLTNDKDGVEEYRLVYRTKAEFRDFAKRLDIMEDLRAGVPRTAYRGVVTFMFNNHRVYLAPGANWKGYQN